MTFSVKCMYFLLMMFYCIAQTQVKITISMQHNSVNRKFYTECTYTVESFTFQGANFRGWLAFCLFVGMYFRGYVGFQVSEKK